LVKKEDPFVLANYRFLPLHRRKQVDEFVKRLDGTCREFAVKRYVEGKTVSQAAEEMGYTERAVYIYRDRIVTLWNLYAEQDKLEYHRQRVLNIMRKHGVIKHRTLLMNLHLKRSGLTSNEFREIINQLVAAGKVMYFISEPKGAGRCGKIYKLN